MKPRQVLVIAFACFGVGSFAAEFPAEIKLTSGAVLHKCSLVRWGNDYVVVKHVGGADPIRFIYIAPDQRAAIIAARDGEKPSDPNQAAGRDTASSTSATTGLVAVVGSAFSGGMEQPYRFAGMHVFFVQKSMAEDWRRTKRENTIPAAATAEVVTDVDGKFSATVPKGHYVLFAEQLRSYRNGNRVTYSWSVDVAATETCTVTLNDDNATYQGMDVRVLRR